MAFFTGLIVLMSGVNQLKFQSSVLT